MVANQRAGKPQHDPRRRLALEGVPDLSAIGDVTEPDVSREALKPAVTSAQSVSPRKRKERLDAHLDNAQDRLRGKMVKLSPSVSAADGISPVKPTSPTTPSEAPSPANTRGIASTGRALSGSLFAAGEPVPSSPVQSPTKTFRVPSSSPSTFYSTLDAGSESSVKPAESPVRRPGAPTPSRWARPDPTTPMPRATGVPITPGSKLTDMDVAKLTDSIPRSVENPVSTPSHWERDPQSFEFDGQSRTSTPSQMSFTSAAYYASTPGHEQGRRLVERRRRKSEPLVQKHLVKLQQSRRQSMGPSKLHALLEEATLDSDGAAKVNTPVLQKEGATQACVGDAKTDITGPLPSFFSDRTPLSKRRDATTPYHDRNTYDIDVRQNLDIFGAKTPTKSSRKAATAGAVKQLASMVEDRCDGHAKVMVTEENGKFIVRFKLPMKYASMFPESQGPDESRFTTTPSAISSSPRISFGIVTNAVPSGAAILSSSSPALPALQLGANNSPHDVAGPIAQTPNSLRETEQTRHVEVEGNTLPHSLVKKEPSTSHLQQAMTPRFLPPVSDADQTLVVGDFNTTPSRAVRTPRARAVMSSSPAMKTPSQLRTPLNAQERTEAPSSGLISDISFEPTFQTPTHGDLAFSPSNQNTTAASAQRVPEAHDTPSAQTPTAATARASPPLNTSFTPVNKPVSRSRDTTPVVGTNTAESDRSSQPSTTPKDMQSAKKEEAPAARDHQQEHDDETREYLSAFLKRSTKPKRPSTTDAGSPIAHTPVRLPLGSKSPNRASESPEKTKRKREPDEPEKSPIKQDPVAKKPRVGGKVGRPAKTAQPASKVPPQKASKGPQKAMEQNESGDDPNEPAVRRSSRLNTKETKSALPTAIKLNRTGAAKDNWPTLNAAVRNEQAELTRQTNSNTRKNRGKAESVQQILARVSSDESSGYDTDEAKKDSKASKRGKTVAWRDPIESHQVQKPARGRPPAQKKQAPAPAEEKKKAVKTTAKSRIAKPAAASLGRTTNGTPAKRVTRARARGGA